MAIVTVKNKYQVVIPRVLDARAIKGKIGFEPKPIVDRGIAEGLEDIQKGRVHGPYRTVAEAMKAFQARSARLSKRSKRAAS